MVAPSDIARTSIPPALRIVSRSTVAPSGIDPKWVCSIIGAPLSLNVADGPGIIRRRRAHHMRGPLFDGTRPRRPLDYDCPADSTGDAGRHSDAPAYGPLVRRR